MYVCIHTYVRTYMHAYLHTYICSMYVPLYAVHLGVILIWRVGEFGFNRQILCPPTLIIVKRFLLYQFLLTLFTKLHARQFALQSNSPNLMFAKCTAYMVYTYIQPLAHMQTNSVITLILDHSLWFIPHAI